MNFQDIKHWNIQNEDISNYFIFSNDYLLIPQEYTERVEQNFDWALCAAVRNLVTAGRYAVKIYDLKASSFCQRFCTGAFSIVSDGSRTTIAGTGDLLNNFMITKRLFGYIGEYDPISTIFDPNYGDATLQLMRFDQSFKPMAYDVLQRKLSFLSLCLF